MPRHILIKLTKTKHKVRILKAAREKQQVAYKGNPIRLTADLSAEALQARREWQDILKVLKGKNLQPRLQYLARISFKIDGKVKNFLDKQKLREFRTTKPAFGEGNGTPLQYFCLENPMDGVAWKYAVHGVSESRTRLSNFTFTFHFHALEKEMASHSNVLAWRIPVTGEPGGLPSMGSHRVRQD